MKENKIHKRRGAGGGSPREGMGRRDFLKVSGSNRGSVLDPGRH